MSAQERKHLAADPRRDADPAAAEGTGAPATKTYRKPMLSKYDQLHGIGLGSDL